MGSYKLSEMGEIPESSMVYPVFMFIDAFKNNIPEKSLNYITEELLYSKDSYSGNFYMRIKQKFLKCNFLDKSKIRVVLYENKKGLQVLVGIPRRDSIINEAVFRCRVKKIEGRFFIIGTN